MNRLLRNAGLPPLEAGTGLLECLGRLVEDHEHFRSLVIRCEPEERAAMYDSMKPYVRFRLHPLEWYIARSKEMADAEGLPTLEADGSIKWPGPDPSQADIAASQASTSDLFAIQKDGNVDLVAAGNDANVAQNAVNAAFAKEVLTLVCRGCTRQEQFLGDTKDDAVINARLAGWVTFAREDGSRCDICPDCPATRKKIS